MKEKISNNKIPILLCVLCLSGSLFISHFFHYDPHAEINLNFVITLVITFFSVSLAIIALMVTLLEKYKDKIANKDSWANASTQILEEICQNTIALLIVAFILVVITLFSDCIPALPKIDVLSTILIFCTLLSFVTIGDTTLSVYKLVIGLKDNLHMDNQNDVKLSSQENNLLEGYRFLNANHQATIDDLLKSLTTMQQVEQYKQK